MNPYARLKVPDLQTFRSNLKSAPFIATERLTAFLPISGPTQTEDIPVSRIIGVREDSSWDLLERSAHVGDPKQYCWALAQRLVSGESRMDEDAHVPVVFIRVGEFFVLEDNGRHRTAALKGIGDPSVHIQAPVRNPGDFSGRIRSASCEIIRHGAIQEFERRREAGLWSGERIEPQPSGLPFKTSPEWLAWRVDSYEGPWVFALDMEEAKQVMEAAASLI